MISMPYQMYYFFKYFLSFHILSFHSVNNALCFTDVFNFELVQLIYFFCCQSFWCHIQESIAEFNVTKLLLCFLLLVLQFQLLLLCLDPLQVHFCICGMRYLTLFSRFRFAVSSSFVDFLQNPDSNILIQISYADFSYIYFVSSIYHTGTSINIKSGRV